MRRLVSGVAGSSGSKARRLLVAAALAGSLPFAAAQHGNFARGHTGGGYAGRFGGGSYGHSFAGYSAPNFVSTFGPHSITGRAGANFVTGGIRYAPNYASSWGIGHPTWRGENGNWNREGRRDRDRDHDRDRFRSGYGGYGYAYPVLPVYNSWVLTPWDMGYQDFNGTSDESENQATAAPDQYESAPPPLDEYRRPYGEPQSDYAPPPPPAAAAPATSSTVLDSEPSLTLIFRDGHQQAIRNYALTSDSVIVLDKASAGRQERIPLADLNLPATEQAAEAAGLDFAPPK